MPLVRSKLAQDESDDTPLEPLTRTEVSANLQSADIDVRRAAIRMAGQASATDILAGHLAIEPHIELRELIQTTMIRIGGPAATKPLIELLRSEDASLRNAVIETLQNMGEDTVPEIERLSSDPDPDVRIFAMNIAQSLHSPCIADIALSVVSRDSHVNVCAAAIDVLTECGRPDMADTLLDVAKRFPDQPFLGFAIRTVLKRIG